MKTTTKMVAVTIVVGLIALLTPIPNVGAAKPSEPPFLKGDRVNLLLMSLQTPPIDEVDVPVDEPFYIWHGVLTCWKSLPPEERSMFLDDSLTKFELDIDCVPQTLRKWMYTFKFEGCNWLGKGFYIQFDPYEFDVGSSLEFEGRWYDYTDPLPAWSHTVTINFDAGS